MTNKEMLIASMLGQARMETPGSNVVVIYAPRGKHHWCDPVVRVFFDDHGSYTGRTEFIKKDKR